MNKFYYLVLSLILVQNVAVAECRRVPDGRGSYDTICDRPKRDGKAKSYIASNTGYAFYNNIGGDFEVAPDRTFLGGLEIGARQNNMDFGVEGIYYNNNYSNPPAQTARIDYGIRSISGLVNFSYLVREFKNGLQLHIGGGAGLSYYIHRSTKTSFSASTDVVDVPGYDLAWQVGLGLSKSLTNDLLFDGKLRLLSLGNFKDTTNSGRVYNVAISVGLKYLF